MPAAASNGIQISHTDSDGQGPAAMFSRGFLLGHTMFDRQVTALAPQYRVITGDQRGHGGTRATGAFTYWDSAADLLALLTARTEITDRILIFGERHLRTIMAHYETHYNGRRPIEAASSARPGPTTPSPTFPTSGFSAGPSSAASSTNTSEPHKAQVRSSGRVLEPRRAFRPEYDRNWSLLPGIGT